MTGRTARQRPQPRGRPGRGTPWPRPAPDALLVAEHCHDYTADLPGDGWHGVMNYAGFTKPVWTWLRDPEDPPDFLGLPLPSRSSTAARWSRPCGSSPRTSPGGPPLVQPRRLARHDPGPHAGRATTRAASRSRPGLLLTMPSIPMVTYGDEIGMEGAYGEDGRRPMPWDEPVGTQALLEVYRAHRGAAGAPWRCGAAACAGCTPRATPWSSCASPREEVALVHIARAAPRPGRAGRPAAPGDQGAVAGYGRPRSPSTARTCHSAGSRSVGGPRLDGRPDAT